MNSTEPTDRHPSAPGGETERSGAETVMPYGTDSSKGQEVEQMFDSIAPHYDLMNNAMTLGMHRQWRHRALDMAAARLETSGVGTPKAILDVATGTGDVAFELADRWPGAKVTGIDLSEGMLEVAARKLAAMPDEGRVSFEAGDCLDLRWRDGSFDLVTVAYGVRNFERLEQGYREMARVLRPGGVLCVVELSCPRHPLLRRLYDIYTHTLIPLAGKLVSGDPRAYTYLPESIAAAPQREAMCEVMKRAGLSAPMWRSLTFGAVTIYLAVKKAHR